MRRSMMTIELMTTQRGDIIAYGSRLMSARDGYYRVLVKEAQDWRAVHADGTPITPDEVLRVLSQHVTWVRHGHPTVRVPRSISLCVLRDWTGFISKLPVLPAKGE